MESWNCRENLHGELKMEPIQRKVDPVDTFSDICLIIFVVVVSLSCPFFCLIKMAKYIG